jgi:hypothetical protein
MKKLTALLLASSFLFSCKKESVIPTPTPVAPTATNYVLPGLWTGTYTTNGSAQPPLYYSTSFFPNGEAVIENILSTGDTSYLKGNWTLAGSTVTCQISTINPSGLPLSQSITGTFSNTGTLTNMTWLDITNPFGANENGIVTSLKKDSTNGICGIWTGTYFCDQAPTQGWLFYTMTLEGNGRIMTHGLGGDGQTYYQNGTWSLSGTTLNIDIVTTNHGNPPIRQHLTFTFNASDRTLTNGTWIDTYNVLIYTGEFTTFSRVRDHS